MPTYYSSYPKTTLSWSNTSSLYYVIITWTGNTTTTSGTYTSGKIYYPDVSYTTSDLSFNTKYTFSLTPYNTYNVAGTVNAMTLDTTPKTSGVYATYSTSSTAQLQWYNSYTYVKVRRSHYYYASSVLTQTGFGDISSAAIANPFTDYDLSGNTTYVYYIQPYITSGATDVFQGDSPQISIKTNVQAPADLSVNFYDSSAISLKFTVPKNTYSTSAIYTAVATYGGNTITATNTTTPVVIMNLSGGTTYTCYVKVTLDSNSALVGTTTSLTQTTSTSSATSISTTVNYVLLSGSYLMGISGSYTLVKFTGNSVIQTSSTISSVPTIIVAGGGGGGAKTNLGEAGGGGGGGGVGYGNLTFISGNSHVVSIGSGGVGCYTANGNGSNGNSTTIIGGGIYETAYGGGVGSARLGNYGDSASSGGSGGGGDSGGSATKGLSSSSVGYSTITYYGNAGGSSSYYASGGGAGAAGTGSSSGGVAGGAGIQWSYNLAYYGGGGGSFSGSGGNGGGGAGTYSAGTVASSGTANTGGGGGAGKTATAGSGGSGVVICAFTTSNTLTLTDDMSGITSTGFYLSFENGATVNDASSNSNSNNIVFSYLNTPTVTSTTSAIGTYSLNLSSNSSSGGTQTTAPLIYSSNLNLSITSSTYVTISFWAKLDSTNSTNNEIIDFFDGTQWPNTTGGYITCNAVNMYSRNSYSQSQSFTTIADNTWHHIVAILYFGTTGTDAITVYRDCTLVTNTLSTTSSSLYSAASSASVSSIPYVNIGAQMNGRSYSTSTSNIAWPIKGYLDDVRFYNYKLDYGQVQQLYNMKNSSAKITSISAAAVSKSTSVNITVSNTNTSYLMLKNINSGTFTGPYTLSSTTGTNIITVTSLSNNTAYSFLVYPYDSNSYQGASSAVVSVNTNGLTFINDISGLLYYYPLNSGDLSYNTSSSKYYIYDYYNLSYNAYINSVNGSIITTSSATGNGCLYTSDYGAFVGPTITLTSSQLLNGASFSCWYKIYQTANPIIMVKTSGNQVLFGLYYTSNRFTVYSNLGSVNLTNSTLWNGSWHHVVGVLSSISSISSTCTFNYYIDGSLTGSISGVYSGSYPANYEFMLLGQNSNTALDSYIDDVRIYNTALSSTIVSQLYNEYNNSALMSLTSTSISAVDSSSVLITLSSSNASYYVIYNDTTKTTYGQDYSISSSTTSYTINGLSPDTSYNFFIIPYSSSLSQSIPSKCLAIQTPISPIIYFKMLYNDVNGTTLYNYASNAYDGTLSLSTAIVTTDTMYPSGCLYTDYRSAGAATKKLTMYPTTVSFSNKLGSTICIWINYYSGNSLNEGGNFFTIVFNNDTSTSIECMYGTNTGTGYNHGLILINNNNSTSYTFNGISNGRSCWGFVCWRVNSNGYWDIYANNTWNYNVTSGGLFNSSYNISYCSIGKNIKSWAYGNTGWNGYVRDLRVYNKALSDSYIASIKLDNPVIWYKFNSADVNGSTVYEHVSKSYSGTMYYTSGGGNGYSWGGSYYTTTGLISTSKYKYGTASLYCNGTSMMMLSNTITINSGGWAISVWFYPTSTAAGPIFSFAGGGYDYAGIYNNSYMNFYSSFFGGFSGATTNSWNHLVLTVSSSTLYIYLNNSLYYSTSFSLSSKSYTYNAVGYNYAAKDGGSTPFVGYIDELKIYDAYLTASEVNVLYSS